MASNRHLGRVIVLQSLYEYELRTLAKDPEVDLDTIIAKNIEQYENTLGDTEFVYNLTHKVVENFGALDKVLQPIAPEWPISSISAIDRNVLRMGLYELSECRETVPPKVAINEAVELAKAFGAENSSRFINGVLGTAYRELGIVEDQNDKPKDEPAKAKAGQSAKSSDGDKESIDAERADDSEGAAEANASSDAAPESKSAEAGE